MHLLTEMIQREMKPALGVTEPGAIAFATALARSYVKGEITRIKLNLSSGIYKNAFSCGIPNSDKTGFLYAGALGAAIAQPELELSLLEATTDADRKLAEQIVAENKIQAELAMISSDIFIDAIVETKEDVCSVIIRDKHTHVEEIKLNPPDFCPPPGPTEDNGLTITCQTITLDDTNHFYKITAKQSLLEKDQFLEQTIYVKQN